jgi:hypothetical protein
MKRMLVVLSSVVAVLLLTVGATSSFGSNGHPTKHSEQVRIESWLLANQLTGDLSGTVKACFKLTGAFKDEGGGPTWSNTSYSSVPSDLATKCDDWTPVGGYNFEPSPGMDHATLYAVHTIAGKKGLIFITFAGHYDLATTYQGNGTWVITGGTGAYEKVHGEGTWTADAHTFPYIRHTEEGVMWK